jgi:hypothetical protein
MNDVTVLKVVPRCAGKNDRLITELELLLGLAQQGVITSGLGVFFNEEKESMHVLRTVRGTLVDALGAIELLRHDTVNPQ